MSISCWKSPVCLLVLLAVTLAGCDLPIGLGDQSSVATVAVQTYQAQVAQEASLRAPTETTAPTATLEPASTSTATLMPSLTPTLIPSPTPDRGWAGTWNMFVEQISKTPFYTNVAQAGDRVTATMYVDNEELHVTGVADASAGRVSGAIYLRGEMLVYFMWQMQPGYNTFIGRWWKGYQSDMWCGGRNGVPVPPKTECLLRP
jgi:hypothetical protein